MMKQTVLFVHPFLDLAGGGTAVAAWMLQALKDDYAVTALTWRPFDIAALNRNYGTSLRDSDIAVRHINVLSRLVTRLDLDPHSIQPGNYLVRVCKRIGRDFDLIVSAYNEMDLGVPGAQYIHYPHHAPHYARYLHCGPSSAWGRVRALLRKEIAPWMVISDFSFERVKRNLTLVNSDWTGRKVKDSYGIDSITLYPPVAGHFPRVPWEDRANAFVCIGRFDRSKRIDWIIETLARVRDLHADLQLHIVGTRGPSRAERLCYSRLLPLLRANKSWVHLHEDLSRSQLVSLVSRQRYGIHAQIDEHFGIAPAELVRAGCITFVHNSGGQVEIIGDRPELLFDTASEAVERITSVLSDPRRQLDLGRHIAARSARFSSERFTSEFLHLIRRWSETMASPPSSRSAIELEEDIA